MDDMITHTGPYGMSHVFLSGKSWHNSQDYCISFNNILITNKDSSTHCLFLPCFQML